MGHIDGGDAKVALHLFQLIAQLYAQLGVQIAQRFVHADDGGPCDQRTGDGHALLLAAGKLADRLFQLFVGQVHLAGDSAHLIIDFLLFELLHLQAEGDVVIDRHGREKRIALKHDADVALFNGDMGNIHALDANRAGNRLNKAGDGAKRSRLTAAGRPQKGEKLAFVHLYVDVVQRLKITELDHNVLQFDHAADSPLYIL